MLYSLNRLCEHTPRVCYARFVLLAHTTCATADAACALFARFEPLLDPCSWRALLVPPLMQLVHSPNASGLYSTRVPWQARASSPMLQLVQSPNPSGLYSTRVTLQTRTALPMLQLVQSPDASGLYLTQVSCQTRSASPMLQLVQSPNAPGGFPCRHELPCRCYRLCSLRTPRAFT